MGHREALLVAAKRLLRERGYARITARDLVAESGANLASIGYHFGSKDALLNQALIEMSSEWGDELQAAVASIKEMTKESDPYRRFEAVWSTIIAEIQKGNYSGDSGAEELLAQARSNPELRAVMAEGFEEARTGLAELYHGQEELADSGTQRALGSLYYALILGLSIQWNIDPDRAPTARDLTEALRLLVAAHTPESSEGG